MTGIQCCGGNSQADVAPHPACFAIPIPPNDFVNRGQQCMNFVRSMTAPRLDCTFGHADQVWLSYVLNFDLIYGFLYLRVQFDMLAIFNVVEILS